MGDEKPMSSGTGAIKRKSETKIRRRDQRSWENVSRSLGSVWDEEKMAIVQEKYKDIYNELRKITCDLQSVEKQYALLQKEKDHIQAELTKNILAKAKLEALCRELQKQNRLIKEENITRVKEEEERRREVATSFTEKLNKLSSLMDQNKDKSVRLREENMAMTNKLTELHNQFQEREGNLANVNRQMDIQKKLSDAQYRKLELEFRSERQLWERERHGLISNLKKSDQANRILQENIQGLEGHLDIYKSQYTDFEATMQKSNRVFDAFKEEMGKMQKSNAALEKERDEFRSRWQGCTNSVVQISEMHQQASGEIRASQKKVAMLEKLCRQLQADRAAYIQQLEEHNIVPVSERIQDELGVATCSSAPAVVAAKKRISSKEKLLVALKSELKDMENQIRMVNKRQDKGKVRQENGTNQKEGKGSSNDKGQVTPKENKKSVVSESETIGSEVTKQIASTDANVAQTEILTCQAEGEIQSQATSAVVATDDARSQVDASSSTVTEVPKSSTQEEEEIVLVKDEREYKIDELYPNGTLEIDESALNSAISKVESTLPDSHVVVRDMNQECSKFESLQATSPALENSIKVEIDLNDVVTDACLKETDEKDPLEEKSEATESKTE